MGGDSSGELRVQGQSYIYPAFFGTDTWWTSGTGGHPSVNLTLADDGNLSIHDANGNRLWAIGDRSRATANGANQYDLRPGDVLSSPNSSYQLRYQTDGDLVLFRRFNDGSFVRRWSSGTAGQPAGHAVMQADGNLVIYRDSGAGNAAWSTRTDGHPGAYVELSDRGALTVYNPDGIRLWSTGPDGGVVDLGWAESITSPNGKVSLTFDGGALKLVNGSGVIWQSDQDVSCLSGHAALQNRSEPASPAHDGNLVI